MKRIKSFIIMYVLSLHFGLSIISIASNAADNQQPVISGAAITNIASSGYDVSCSVNADKPVTKVLFPTWTTKNGQDDIVWTPGKYEEKDKKWHCHISTGNHRNEIGEYVTHIYAYDQAGNHSGFALNSIMVVDDNTNKLLCDKPDVRYMPVEFSQFFGKDPSAFRGTPGFEEAIFDEGRGAFRYYLEGNGQPLQLIEVNYKNNTIYDVNFSFYISDRNLPYASNIKIWGIYPGMNGEEACALLAQHGYDCFFVQPSMWQWKTGYPYIVDVTWDSDGTVDNLGICQQ